MNEYYFPISYKDRKETRKWLFRNTTKPKFKKPQMWGKAGGVYLNGPDAIAFKLKYGLS